MINKHGMEWHENQIHTFRFSSTVLNLCVRSISTLQLTMRYTRSTKIEEFPRRFSNASEANPNSGDFDEHLKRKEE